MCIHWYIICLGIQSKIRVYHCFRKLFENVTVASVACRKRLEKLTLFPQFWWSLGQIIYFLSKKGTDYLCSAFSRSEYLFPKSASPSPLRIKLLSFNEATHSDFVNARWRFKNISIRFFNKVINISFILTPNCFTVSIGIYCIFPLCCPQCVNCYKYTTDLCTYIDNTNA